MQVVLAASHSCLDVDSRIHPWPREGIFFCTALLLKLIVVGKLPHWWEIWPRHISLRSTLINPRHDHFPEDTPCPVREATSYFKSFIIKGRICYYGLSVNGFAIQIPTAFGSKHSRPWHVIGVVTCWKWWSVYETGSSAWEILGVAKDGTTARGDHYLLSLCCSYWWNISCQLHLR